MQAVYATVNRWGMVHDFSYDLPSIVERSHEPESYVILADNDDFIFSVSFLEEVSLLDDEGPILLGDLTQITIID